MNPNVNPSWLDWVPGYFLFKKAPTRLQLSEYRLAAAKRALQEAEFAVVQHRAEVICHATQVDHLRGYHE